jgi:anti-sigma-K factor RskA
MNGSEHFGPHPEQDLDFDLCALGMLDETEQHRIEAHAAHCPDCAKKLSAALGRCAMLGLAAPQVSPAGNPREQLLERIRAAARPSAPPPSARPSGAKPRIRWSSAILAPVAAVLLAATLLLWYSNARLNRRLEALRAAMQHEEDVAGRNAAMMELLAAPDTQSVALQPAGGSSGSGVVHFNARRKSLCYLGTLPPPPEGKVYELWAIPGEGAPLEAGVLAPDARGQCVLMLPSFQAPGAPKAFAVTIEPAGGVPAPTGPKVQIGPAS